MLGILAVNSIPHLWFVRTLSLSILALCTGSVSAQIDMPVFGKQTVTNGYAKDIEGEVIPYFSVYPEFAKDALLTRATDGKKTIAWETAKVPFLPQDENIPYYYFSWIAGHSTGTNGGDRDFDLYINDKLALTFTTHAKSWPSYWTFGAADSTRLVFEGKKKDNWDDAHGIAYLRVPRSRCTPGEPLRLKVVGHAQNSNDWWMTFRCKLEEKVEVEALPFAQRTNDPSRPLLFTVMHFGSAEKLKVRIGAASPAQTFPVRNGLQVIEAHVPNLNVPYEVHVLADLGDRSMVDTTFEIEPIIHRDIYLIHHSHNDIGYSHLQTEVQRIQNNNIREAMKQIDHTRDYPAGSKFIWNIESLWAVENFLGEASAEEKRKFIGAVREGSIALSANYANILTGLCTPEEMHWIVEYADSLRRWYGFPIDAAMQTDIPGMSWSMVDAYAAHGIRYLSQGPNYVPALPDKGDRIGATLRAQGDKPYWWKGTTGKDSILVWTAGHGYSSWHGFKPGDIKERGPRKIAAYLNELDSTGYPYEMVQWRYSLPADNGITDSTLSDFVRDWNERYISPRLIISNVSDMFHEFEKRYGKSIPTWSRDFTPYWEDGAYSTAKEEGDVRVLSARLSNLIDAAKTSSSRPSGILGKPIDPHLLSRAKRSIVMWHEHTWGAWCSISDPDAPFTTEQWKYKKAFADSVWLYVRSIEKSIGADPTERRWRSLVLDTLEYLGLWLRVDGLDPSEARSLPVAGSIGKDTKSGLEHNTYLILKDGVRVGHSTHLALPFNIPNATVRIGISDTCITPESGQIPGSNNDFFCAQRWIDVSNDSMGVTIVCPQGALWEIGEMVDERKINDGHKLWKSEAHSSSTLYLYALNNYWHTNFKADQEGPITFDLYLKMHGPFKLEEARRFGLEMTRPLITWWR